MELWRGDVKVANGASGGDYSFRGLERGLYTLKAGGKSREVLVKGDQTMDLAGKTAAAPSGDMKKMIGIILILAINLAGLAIIIRIWKRGE